MNRFTFIGNLTKDIEYRVSSEHSVARGAIALNRGKDKNGNDKGADFINIVAFGNTAEKLNMYGKKGKKLLLEGRVKTGSYEKDGQRVYTTEFIVDHFEFCDSLNSATQATQDSAEGFLTVPEGLDEELPFA